MTPFVLINDSENGSSHRGIGVRPKHPTIHTRTELAGALNL